MVQQSSKLETAKKATATILDYTKIAFSGAYYYGGKALGSLYDTFLASEKGK